MDTSVFLSIIIFLVSLIIIAVGVYVILLLREARENLRRLNHVLSHLESLVETVDTKVTGPFSNIVGMAAAVREGLSLFNTFKKRDAKERKE